MPDLSISRKELAPEREIGRPRGPRSGAAPLALIALLGAACDSSPTPPAGSFELGYRAGTALGDGEPSNDLPVLGSLAGRYRLSERWAVGAALELYGGDFERPYEIVDESSPDEIDTDVSYLAALLFLERTFPSDGGAGEWFLTGGLGLADPEVDDVSGPLSGGGSFAIETDTNLEPLVSGGGGYRHWLSEHVALEGLARYDVHFADWELGDTITGASGSVDNYETIALLVGLTFSF